MKNSLLEIKQALQQSLLVEASSLKEEGNDSLDSQVDRYLMGYEHEARNLQKEGLDIMAITSRILREAPEDDKKTSRTIDEIDVRSFAYDVARLVDNVDALLEFKSTILRRAINYLAEGYDDETVRRFVRVMEDDFDMAVGESKRDREEASRETPVAGEAGPFGMAGGV